MFATRQAVSRLLQQTARRYHAGEKFRQPSMDDLPVPRGAWLPAYEARQRRYNATLLFGVAFAVGTLVIAKTSGLLYLNYAPPKSID